VFEVQVNASGEVTLYGRFDAGQIQKAKLVFDEISSSCVVDFTNLDYISSCGLSVLLVTEKRLRHKGQRLRLTNMNEHIKQVFKYAGLDSIFEIE
jgi:anti-sigma B factor antagonist